MTKLSYLAVAELKKYIIFSEKLFPFFSDRLYWFIYMTSTILVFL